MFALTRGTYRENLLCGMSSKISYFMLIKLFLWMHNILLYGFSWKYWVIYQYCFLIYKPGNIWQTCLPTMTPPLTCNFLFGLSLKPPGNFDTRMHKISGVSSGLQFVLLGKVSHLTKLWNFLKPIASPGLTRAMNEDYHYNFCSAA